jgi:hypothetical protein
MQKNIFAKEYCIGSIITRIYIIKNTIKDCNTLTVWTKNKERCNTLTVRTQNKEGCNTLTFRTQNKERCDTLTVRTQNKEHCDTLTVRTQKEILITPERNRILFDTSFGGLMAPCTSLHSYLRICGFSRHFHEFRLFAMAEIKTFSSFKLVICPG